MRSPAPREPATPTHVAPPASIKHTVGKDQIELGSTSAPEEQQADTMAEGVADHLAPSNAPTTGDRALNPNERSVFESHYDADLGAVKLHTGSGAEQASAELGADAFSVGRDIWFGRGVRLDSPQGSQTLAHEVAHTAQHQRGAGRSVIRRQPTSLGAIDAARRQQIQVSTIPITVPPERVTAFFELMPSGRHGETRSIGAVNSFGTGIDASLQTGLGSIGAWLGGDTNALPANTTLEVPLDLTAFGGASRLYRFTRFQHGGTAAQPGEVMLVEDLGAAAAAPTHTGTVPSSVTAGGATFPLTGTWDAGEFAVVQQAIQQLPPAAQTAANGVTLRRRSGAAPGTEAGEYDPQHDRIDLFDQAFPTSSNRFGGMAPAVRAIVHEIGHAIDLRPLEQAWTTFNAAGQSNAARTPFLAERSPSGSRWIDSSGTFNQDEAMGDRSPAFRAAVRADGVRDEPAPPSGQAPRQTPEGTTAQLAGGVTTYSDTGYQELYAESFSLYVTSPQTLQALRPQTYAYFHGLFPAAAPAAGAAGTGAAAGAGGGTPNP